MLAEGHGSGSTAGGGVVQCGAESRRSIWDRVRAVHSLINLCLLGSLPRPGDGHMPTQRCCS